MAVNSIAPDNLQWTTSDLDQWVGDDGLQWVPYDTPEGLILSLTGVYFMFTSNLKTFQFTSDFKY